jgi:vacuolar-type H+-ATPase subunit I/STV1
MSPAFVNRFDVIVLEDQIESIGEQINELIKFFLNRCNEERILEEKEAKEKAQNDEFGFDSDDENEEEEEIEEKKGEKVEKIEEFDEKLINLIKNKFYELNERNSEKVNPDVKNIRTISALNKLCRGVYRLDKTMKEKKKL